MKTWKSGPVWTDFAKWMWKPSSILYIFYGEEHVDKKHTSEIVYLKVLNRIHILFQNISVSVCIFKQREIYAYHNTLMHISKRKI